jgi:sodium/proline symporter
MIIGRSIYTIWNVLALFGAIFTGFAGIAYFEKVPLSNPETVFIEFAKVLFHPWVTGVLLVAVLSAIMSTISTQLLISATALSEDLYKGLFRKKANEKELMLITRIGIVLISIFAIVLAFNPENSVLGLVGYAWAGFGSVFGPTIILAIFWKGATRNGILAGMLVGGLTVIFWTMLSTPPLGTDGLRMEQSEAFIPFYLYELVPGFFLAFISVLIFSKLGPAPSKEMVEEYDLVKASNI